MSKRFFRTKEARNRAVVVVEWSASSPSAATIRVRIPLTANFFESYEKMKMNKIEPGFAHYEKKGRN